jgi:formylmethanofuran dehydrogenase subunit A
VLIRLKGGRVVDPVNDRDAIGDVFIENGRIVEGASNGRKPDETYDLAGKVVMAGGVDIHSHIAGSNVTLGRALMPELPALAAQDGASIAPSPDAWGAYATGIRYAEMGYTTVIEPALIPTHAIEAQIELASIPIIDVGALVILGNDDFSLGLLRDGGREAELQDYVGRTLGHAKAIVLISGDILRQFDGRRGAHPKKWAIDQGDGNGTGVVPYQYRAGNFANAVQWSVGLEIVLLAKDLWRVLFSTDHPNGALFVRYPEIVHLLMDRDERARMLERLPESARQVSNLPSIGRELTLSEIAIITRGASARLLGLTDRGHLGLGAVADVAVYTEQKNKTTMFASAHLLFKDGALVVRDGEVVNVTWGKAYHVAPGVDAHIERRLAAFYDRYYGVHPSSFGVPAQIAGRPDRLRRCHV